MKQLKKRLLEEPVLLSQIAALVVAGLAAWGLPLTDAQELVVMGVAALVAALVGRSQVTPLVKTGAAEDHDGELLAGPAAPVPEDTPVDVVPKGVPFDERGAYDSSLLVAIACVVVILCGLVWLVQRL